PGLAIKLFKEERGPALARRSVPGCPSLCGCSGILTWNGEGYRGKPQPGSEPATMADPDSCVDAWFFRFTMKAANWWRMRAARWMARSHAICFRRDSAKRRWVLISIARSSPRPRKGGWRSVEGLFDCVKVHQAGYDNVVAWMGASRSDRQSELLDKYFRELVVMLDGDEAGRRASRVLATRWPAAHTAWVPAGRQPDQL